MLRNLLAADGHDSGPAVRIHEIETGGFGCLLVLADHGAGVSWILAGEEEE